MKQARKPRSYTCLKLWPSTKHVTEGVKYRATSVPKTPVLYYWMHWCVVCLSSCLMGRRGVVGRTTEDQPWSKGDFQWSVPAPQAKLYSRDKILLNGVTNRKLPGEKSTCRNCNFWFSLQLVSIERHLFCTNKSRVSLKRDLHSFVCWVFSPKLSQTQLFWILRLKMWFWFEYYEMWVRFPILAPSARPACWWGAGLVVGLGGE